MSRFLSSKRHLAGSIQDKEGILEMLLCLRNNLKTILFISRDNSFRAKVLNTKNRLNSNSTEVGVALLKRHGIDSKEIKVLIG